MWNEKKIKLKNGGSEREAYGCRTVEQCVFHYRLWFINIWRKKGRSWMINEFITRVMLMPP